MKTSKLRLKSRPHHVTLSGAEKNTTAYHHTKISDSTITNSPASATVTSPGLIPALQQENFAAACRKSNRIAESPGCDVLISAESQLNREAWLGDSASKLAHRPGTGRSCCNGCAVSGVSDSEEAQRKKWNNVRSAGDHQKANVRR